MFINKITSEILYLKAYLSFCPITHTHTHINTHTHRILILGDLNLNFFFYHLSRIIMKTIKLAHTN